MRTAEDVLTVIQDRGRRGLPIEDVYRQLYNPTLYLRAYGNIYSHNGAMTPGTTPETVDRMSLRKIEQIIDDIRHERFRWTPVRRTSLPRQDGKKRLLGIPTWTDKLVLEVVRSLLEAYYEPQFSDRSHGFRPGRGCHTALIEIYRTWKGTKWFIQGDITSCFDNIDHSLLSALLARQIQDNRFLRLMSALLQAGYGEQWVSSESLSGVPQGSGLSPLLANIYLDQMDTWVEQTLMPEHTRGAGRAVNRTYRQIRHQMEKARQNRDIEAAREYEKHLRTLPFYDVNDPLYRRLKYVRYADDFLIGFAGPKAEAEQIKVEIRDFLHDHLKLEFSEQKTLVTHARTQGARFLGYDIKVQHEDTLRDRNNTRSVNGVIGLYVPEDRLQELCARYMKDGKPAQLPALVIEPDFDIVSKYGAQWRHYAQWFLLAHNVRELTKLHWIMQSSLLRTLAWKHKSTVRKMAAKHKAKLKTEDGIFTCIEVKIERENKPPLVARFGGIPLRHKKEAIIRDQLPFYPPRRTELIKRLLADTCEICGAAGDVEVHHVRKLADLAKRRDGRERPEWAKRMAARNRKTMVVCPSCHDDIHAGRMLKTNRVCLEAKLTTGEPDDTETVTSGSVRD